MEPRRLTRDTDGGPDDERALSDVVAFTLTFSIIIVSVALVSMFAVGSLVDLAGSQHVQNNDRGTQAVASTLDNIHRSGDAYRQFDISPGDGNLFFNQTKVTIKSSQIDLSALDGNPDTAEIPIGALETRFERSDRTIYVAYEGGGVFRTDYATPRYGPSITCSPDGTTIVSLVNLTTDNSIYEAGAFNNDIVIKPSNVPDSVPFSGNNEYATFEAERVDHQQIRDASTTLDLKLDVSETAHPEQWERFFENANGWGWNGGATQGECLNNDDVLIRVVTIKLSKPLD
ncbi:hypothetical protein Huta_2861 [Halorhabdus utahensis DSM 12940]|uniref:Uncharacterized protein n=1 Tax=Halorhabdus utahensis (strain DSM 12940 / JCM 11049 / AX-2) TaxID=519442 RepID=C7NRR7_HALUD|nr:hypothetical protein [Halorhabdus utahensis]ACV13022.1 hypothetical protein Huta_2861 [Halorhabdus utahensis DSM 12940]